MKNLSPNTVKARRGVLSSASGMWKKVVSRIIKTEEISSEKTAFLGDNLPHCFF